MEFKPTLFTAAISLAAAATLTACGGGGSSEETSATAGATATSNVFETQQATYALPCENTTRPNSTQTTNTSRQHVIEMKGLVGSDTVNFSVRFQYYSTPMADPAGAKCESAALVLDATISGQLRDTGATKAYTLKDGTSITTRVVEGTLNAVSMSKGTITGKVPLPGAKSKTTYLLVGDKVYYGSGLRGADGLYGDVAVATVIKQ